LRDRPDDVTPRHPTRPRPATGDFPLIHIKPADASMGYVGFATLCPLAIGATSVQNHDHRAPRRVIE